jgi:hypothetical protein
MIKSIMPTTEKGDKRMVIVDNNGTEIADSSFNNNKLESFKNLELSKCKKWSNRIIDRKS